MDTSDTTPALLGTLEQLIDAAKAARKSLKKDEKMDAADHIADALKLATAAVMMVQPAK